MSAQHRVTALGDLASQRPIPDTPAASRARPGRSGADLQAELEAWRDLQPTVVRCLHCPAWQASGTAEEARAASAAHRAAAHPGQPRKRKRGHQQQKQEAMLEVEKRRAVLGEEAAVGQTAVSSSALRVGELERAASSPNAASVREGEPGTELHAAATACDVGSRTPGATPAAPSPSRTPETNPFGLARAGRGYRWTREASIAAVRAYAEAVGRAPGQNASRGEPVGTLPSLTAARTLFGGWAGLVEAAGYQRPAWGGTRLAPEGVA